MAKLQAPAEKFTNGWIADLDGRTGIAQNMRERYKLLTDDLGGVDRLSYAERSLAERGLWLEYWLADQERLLATGGEFDVGKWTQACNSLQGIYSKLGLQRQARDVPDLGEYLAKRTG